MGGIIMKKLFLSFAALVAIVSCVEEKGLEPQQPVSGNQLTIKAVTAPATKTVLGDELPAEGISVLWEEDDAITVLLKDGNSGTAYQEFTAAQVNGTNADFTGEFTAADLEYFDTENVTAAYAIYPSASVSDGVITHTLSEEQDGDITSGMNLAYAALNADEVLNGTATSASFNNALALIQITVPADVMYVSLSTGVTGDALVGEATYTYSDGGLTQNVSISRKTVTLKDGDAALEAGTYSLLVFPSTKNNTLTLKMEGTDGAVYEKSLNDIKLMASQCYTINLEKLSYVGEVLPASPLGGEFVIPFVTTEDYTYTVKVEIEEGDDENWIVYEETRGFHQDEIVLALETNDSGKERSANVTVTIENVGSKTFVVSQASAFMDFVYTEENPIEWEETFGLYSDESLNTKLATFTNVFTIELSDDFSKGTYKLKNLFVVDLYYGEGHQMITNKGGDYYANYDAATGNLTVLMANAVASYTFPGDIVLTYDSANKTFSALTLTVTLLNGSAYYSSGATRYIGGYAAAVKAVDEPETPGDGNEEGGVDAASLAGNYSEEYSTFMSNGSGTMTITVLGNDISVSMCNGSLTCSATLSSDGKTLTVNSDGVGYQGNINDPFSGNTVLNISNVEGKIKLTLSTSTNLWGMSFLTSYTATMN